VRWEQKLRELDNYIPASEVKIGYACKGPQGMGKINLGERSADLIALS
jgi:hypothetical protein